MVGDYTDKRGYIRNFAYRSTRPILIREDKVIELFNPTSVINNNLIVQAKPNQQIEKKDWITITEGSYQGSLHA
jgi:hypothetical protein